jgi:hypothetical protein
MAYFGGDAEKSSNLAVRTPSGSMVGETFSTFAAPLAEALTSHVPAAEEILRRSMTREKGVPAHT